jgi:hypothetical protein
MKLPALAALLLQTLSTLVSVRSFTHNRANNIIQATVSSTGWANIPRTRRRAPHPLSMTIISPFDSSEDATPTSASTATYTPLPSNDEPLELTWENVDMVLEEMRPYLLQDGGNVAISEIDGPVVRLELQVRLFWFILVEYHLLRLVCHQLSSHVRVISCLLPFYLFLTPSIKKYRRVRAGRVQAPPKR